MSARRHEKEESKPPVLLTQTAYAKHRKERGLIGITPAAVSYALKEGRIHHSPGTRLLDPVECDRQWLENTDARPNPSSLATASATDADYNISRAKREFYESELARLKVEEKRGQLIPAATVRKVLFESGRIVGAGMDNIVSQLAPDLASETSIAAVERLLKTSFDKLRNEMADRIEKLDQAILAEIGESGVDA